MLQKERDNKRLEKKVGAWFKWQGRLVTKKLPRLKKYFQESVSSDIDAILDSAFKVTVMTGEQIFEAGLVPAVSQGYTALQDEIGMRAAFELKQPEAVKWAKTQAAKDVALVNDTTKETIRGMVTRGIEKGSSYDTVARQISKRFEEFAVGKPQLHIESRAHLVAINENAVAYEQGGRTLVDDIEATGIDMETAWGGPDDDRTSDGCRDNMANEWIPVGQTFSSGDQHPPRFPGCRHHGLYRVARS